MIAIFILDIYWQWPFFPNCDWNFFSRKSRSSRGQSHISPLLLVQREFATDAWEEARSVDINRGWGPVADARHRAYSRGYKNIAFISHRGVSSRFFSSSSLSLPFATCFDLSQSIRVILITCVSFQHHFANPADVTNDVKLLVSASFFKNISRYFHFKCKLIWNVIFTW